MPTRDIGRTIRILLLVSSMGILGCFAFNDMLFLAFSELETIFSKPPDPAVADSDSDGGAGPDPLELIMGVWDHYVNPGPSVAGPALPESTTCNASGYLTWEEEIIRKETTAFGTDICDYKITFRNDHDQWTVMIVGYVHDADVWQALEQGEWRIIGTMEPGSTYEWSGYYNYSHDPDAVGPTMTMLEKAALLFKDGQCEALRSDESFLEGLAVELPVSCME